MRRTSATAICSTTYFVDSSDLSSSNFSFMLLSSTYFTSTSTDARGLDVSGGRGGCGPEVPSGVGRTSTDSTRVVTRTSLHVMGIDAHRKVGSVLTVASDRFLAEGEVNRWNNLFRARRASSS